MPITPFHFGPGAALNAMAPRTVSFVGFVAANVLIDLEPLYYMLTRQYPLHRFFHTYVGATFVTVGAVLLVCVLAAVTRRLTPPLFRTFFASPIRATIIGAALGAYSHVVLDSIMHDDIRPLAPFSASNVLHGLISLHALHWFCIYAGGVGIVTLVARYWIRGKKTRSD